jgi:hypothetical protein
MATAFQTSSAGLIIRQKEPANLETLLDQVDSYLTPDEDRPVDSREHLGDPNRLREEIVHPGRKAVLAVSG